MHTAGSPAATAGSGTRERLLAPTVLLLALAVTVALSLWLARVHRAEDEALLERRTEAFALALSGRVQAYVDTLPGLRQFGVFRKSPTDLEFDQYVRAISLERRFPGLALTFFAERVTLANRAGYIDAVRGDRSLNPAGHPGWTIQPPGDRAQYMVIRHAHPVDSVSFGYDLYDPAQTYRLAVDRAIETGGNVATGPLLLARDRFAKGRPELTSVVIRMPLYAGGVTPDTVEGRRANAQGVAGISFSTQELARSVLTPELGQGARVRIVDLQARDQGANALVFDSAWAAGAASAQAPSRQPFRFVIDVADRSWQIEVTPNVASPLFALREDTGLVLGLGLLLAGSLAVMTRTLVDANRRAESKVRAATAQLLDERDSLERSERRYRMLFENSQEATLRTRPDGAVLAANPAAQRLFGWSEEEMRRLMRAGMADESDPRLREFLESRARTGHAQGLLRMRKSGGTVFEAEVTSSVYLDSDGQLVTSVLVRDVTEREHAAQRQARLTAILDSTPDFVGSADDQGRNIFLNRAWRRVLGRADDEDVSSLRIEDCHPAWATRIVLETGIPAAALHGAWSGETAIRAGDGGEIPVSQVILCHRDAKGEVTHFSTIARDLTELKRAEAERRALEGQLRESQKMESIGTLAGGVAHDFNNLLAVILGNTGLVTQTLDAAHPAQRNLALVKQAASRARTLVRQILTFSRRATQEFTVQPLGPLVEEAVSLLRSTLPPTVNLTSQVAAGPLYVLTDSAQMQQVVMNLCTNAWQSLPEGRGVVEVSLDAVEFQPGDAVPGGLPSGHYARLRVRDDGAGMDAATRQRVFEPFFTTKRVGEGTGLGLAVVHGIVAGSSGAITIASVPGAGSTFDVYLPRQHAPARPEAATRDELSGPNGGGEHILYVDDDEVVALTIQALLEHAGYRVTWRANGTDALAEFKASPGRYSVVISDYNMPDLSGLVVARRILDIDPRLPVVITSGYVTDELQAQAKACGVKAVLLKEYSLERLAGLVHGILSGG